MNLKPRNNSWKRNLYIVWFGCFLTGAGFSLIMPFLPLYVEELGIKDHESLNLWTGVAFSITFLFSAIAAPFWGKLSDRKGRKLMLLRSALGMAIVMVLIGFAQNIWQLLILRALLGILGVLCLMLMLLSPHKYPLKKWLGIRNPFYGCGKWRINWAINWWNTCRSLRFTSGFLYYSRGFIYLFYSDPIFC